MKKTSQMETQRLSQLLDKSPFPKLTQREVLESYSHIELTEDEMDEAIIWGKRKKEEKEKSLMRQLREEEARKKLLQTTNYNIIKSFMIYRAEQQFGGRFILDKNNEIVFELLCNYFGNDEKFISLANNIDVQNPSLEKGVLLAGNFGVGKTWFMKLFSQNQRQCFIIRNAKMIADMFQSDGEESMNDFTNLHKNPINDAGTFFQPVSGLCIDDLGTEDIKVHFGNKKNVIGDIIEKRYFNKHTGVLFHGTTNLTSGQLNEFYGGRVVSRMREIFNFIELRGNDRRK